MKKIWTLVAAMCCAMMVNAAGLGTRVWVCDSLHTDYASGTKYKVEYTYDDAGQEIKQISSEWKTDKWVPYSKTESVYSSTGKIKELTGYTWNATDNVWKPNWQELMTFDTKDSLMSFTKLSWNEDKRYFEPEVKSEFYYNEKGQRVTEYIYSWNITAGMLEPYSKMEYSYDADGRLKDCIYDLYYSGWNHSDKTVYTYDTKGRLTEIDEFKWNSGTWDNNKHTEQTYTGNNDISTSNKWEWISGAWVPTVYQQYSYDTEYRLLGRDEYHWDSSTPPGSWKIFYKNERTYGAKGNLTSIIEYRTKSNVLTEDAKIEYTYDDDNNMLTNTNYNWKSGAWELYCVQERFYHQMTVGFEQVNSEDVRGKSLKVIRNGVMYILRGEEVYSINGLKVRD